MAATEQGRWLTEQHRLEQQQIRNGFLLEFLALWALLDSTRLDATSPGWIAAVMRLIADYRIRSARAAVTYYTGYRRAELPREAAAVFEVPRILAPPQAQIRPVTPAPAPVLPGRTGGPPARPGRGPARRDDRSDRRDERDTRRDRDRVEFTDSTSAVDVLEALEEASRRGRDRRTRIVLPDLDFTRVDRAARVSLQVTGPAAQKHKMSRGKPLPVARDESFVHAAGAASRHVLLGGRQSLLRLTEADDKVLGWVRVTGANPCAFCAMLASRGITWRAYSRNSFSESDPRFEGPGTVKVHDNCACTIEPVLRSDTRLPGRADEFRQLWDSHIRGKYSGAEARNAWRRLYEARQRDQRRAGAA